jgi:hypothetical protein
LANVVIAFMAVTLGGAWFSQVHLARELHIAYRFGQIVERECGKAYLENETGAHQLYNALLSNYKQLETSAWYMNLFFSLTFIAIAAVIGKILYDSNRKSTLYFFVVIALIYFIYSRDSYATVLGSPFPTGEFYVSTLLPEDYVDSTHVKQLRVFGIHLILVCFLLYVLVPLQSLDTAPKFNGCAFSEVRTHMAYALGIMVLVMALAVSIVGPTYKLNNQVLVEYDGYLKRLEANIEGLSEDITRELESNYFRKNDKVPVITDRNLKSYSSYVMHEKGKEFEFLPEIEQNKQKLVNIRTLLYDMRVKSHEIGENAMDYSKLITGATAVILIFLMYVAYHMGYKRNDSMTVVFITAVLLLMTFVLTWVGWIYQAIL